MGTKWSPSFCVVPIHDGAHGSGFGNEEHSEEKDTIENQSKNRVSTQASPCEAQAVGTLYRTISMLSVPKPLHLPKTDLARDRT